MPTNRLLAALSLGHTVEHWYEAAFWMFLPIFARELDLSFVQVGALATARSFLSAIMHIIVGAVSDVVGRPLILLTACLVWLAVGFFVMGLAPGFISLMIVAGAFGAAVGFWHPPAMAVISRVFPERRGYALSAHELAGNVGNMVTPIAIGAALVAFHWQAVMAAHLVPGVLVALLFWLGMPRAGTGPVAVGVSVAGSLATRLSEYRGVARSLLSNPIILGMSAVSGLRTGAQTSLSAFVPLYLTFTYAMSPDQVSFYLSALFALGIISPLIGGTISDRVGRRPVLLIGLFAAGILALALPTVAPGPLLLGLLAGTGLFLYAMRSVIFAHALDVSSGAGAASTVGFIFGVQGVVAGLAPAILGALADQAGPAIALTAAGVLSLIAGLVVVALPARAPISTAAAPRPASRAGT